jgi:hypothetical protein
MRIIAYDRVCSTRQIGLSGQEQRLVFSRLMVRKHKKKESYTEKCIPWHTIPGKPARQLPLVPHGPPAVQD